MNNVSLIGRLIGDPELRQTPQGTAICNFTISVNRNVKGDDGYYKSDLIRCIAWRQTGEFIAKHFTKGSMIGITGSIQVSQFTDKETGKNRNSFDVVVNNSYFVGSKTNKSADIATDNDLADFSQIAADSDDLPFRLG